MIAFRYGGAARSGSSSTHPLPHAAGTPTSAAIGGGATPAVTYYTKRTLPLKYQPQRFTDEEADAVRLGGASPYADTKPKRK